MTSSDSQDQEYIFFWREFGSEWAVLSQWYPATFVAADPAITYSSAEQYMMYQKAILFNDAGVAASILESTSPKDQKALGRLVSNFDKAVWLENRERIVRDGSYYKFKNGKGPDGESLKEMLLATGDIWLAEASPRDRIWGIGFGERTALEMKSKWGLNLLGNALAWAREKIREEEKEGKRLLE